MILTFSLKSLRLKSNISFKNQFMRKIYKFYKEGTELVHDDVNHCSSVSAHGSTPFCEK